MPELEASVLIARPVGEVWHYVTNAENLPVWVPVLHGVTQITDGPVRVGTRWQGTMRFLGTGFTGLVEVTHYELNNAAEFKSAVYANASRKPEQPRQCPFGRWLIQPQGPLCDNASRDDSVLARAPGLFRHPVILGRNSTEQRMYRLDRPFRSGHVRMMLDLQLISNHQGDVEIDASGVSGIEVDLDTVQTHIRRSARAGQCSHVARHDEFRQPGQISCIVQFEVKQ
jgi:hypothetical protein